MNQVLFAIRVLAAMGLLSWGGVSALGAMMGGSGARALAYLLIAAAIAACVVPSPED